MSEHLVAASTNNAKTVCHACGRNVRTVVIDGVTVALDTEVIAVVDRAKVGRNLTRATISRPRGSQVEKLHAHRVHAELCGTYQREAERERWRDEKKAAEALELAARQKAERARMLEVADEREKRAANAEAQRRAAKASFVARQNAKIERDNAQEAERIARFGEPRKPRGRRAIKTPASPPSMRAPDAPPIAEAR